MDVVPDRDFLGEFISSLEKEEDAVEDARVVQNNSSSSSSSSSVPPPLPSSSSLIHEKEEEGKESDVWVDIEYALHRWTASILDAESRHDKTASFRDNIEASLRRQQLDGFLDHHDVAELRHVADLFMNLLHATSCYRIGCVFLKHDIITLLLELHTLKQITNTMFVEACLQL